MYRFALDRLHSSELTHLDGDESIYGRHAYYYLDIVAEQKDDLHGAIPRTLIKDLQAEISNIRQALRWAVEHQAWSLLDRCLVALGKLYDLLGLYEEARIWLEMALEHLCQDLTTPASEQMRLLQSRLLVHAAERAIIQADYEQAMNMATEAYTLAVDGNAPNLQGWAQATIGWVYQIQGEFDKALDHQQPAYLLLRQSNSQRRLANLLLQMGNTYRDQHHWDEALELHAEAQDLFQGLGDRWGQCISLRAMGAVYFGSRNTEKALHCHQQALELAQQIQVKQEIVACSAELGKVYWHRKQYDQALRALLRAVGLAEELGGLKYTLPTYYRIIGEVYKATGDFHEARFHLEHALRLSQEYGTKVQIATTLASSGFLNFAEGHYKIAQEQYHKGLQLVQQLGERRLSANYVGILGLIDYKLKEYPLARQQLEHSVQELRALGVMTNPIALVSRLENLAQVYYHLADYVTAESKCLEALEIIEESSEGVFAGIRGSLDIQLTLAKCRFALGQPSEALRQAENLLKVAENDEQRAMVHDTLWEISQDRAHAETALDLFRSLYEHTPKRTFQEKVIILEQQVSAQAF